MPAALKQEKRPFKTGKGKEFDSLFVFKEMAVMLAGGMSIDDVKTFLNKKISGYRDKLSGNPDGECNSAARIAEALGLPAPIKNYKGATTRKNIKKEKLKKPHAPTATVDDRPFAWAKDDTGKMKKYPFAFLGKGYCGDCWICGLPVYFYFNEEFTTGCGECEHIGGIVASLLSGMLIASMRDEAVYNHGIAHPHCNQKKSDYLSMMFNNANNRWVYSPQGTSDIVFRIFTPPLHKNEYDPVFAATYRGWTTTPEEIARQTTEMTGRIRVYTESTWCPAANANLAAAGPDKIDLAKRLLTAMMWTVNNRLNKFVRAAAAGGAGGMATVVPPRQEDVDEDLDNDDEFNQRTLPFPDGIFGVRITYDDEVDEILKDPESKNLLYNLIIACYERMFDILIPESLDLEKAKICLKKLNQHFGCHDQPNQSQMIDEVGRDLDIANVIQSHKNWETIQTIVYLLPRKKKIKTRPTSRLSSSSSFKPNGKFFKPNSLDEMKQEFGGNTKRKNKKSKKNTKRRNRKH